MSDRRSFLKATAAIAAAVATSRTRAASAAEPNADRIGALGVQLFSLPKALEQDLDGALAMLAALGYKEVELFGPYPFSTPEALESWKAMGARLGFTGSGYFGRDAKGMRAALDRHGLTAPAIHIELASLRDRLEQVGEAAAVLGHRYVGISNIPAQFRKTLDDYRRMADTFNEIGRRARPMGFKVLYHNHGYGIAPMEGKIPLRELIARTDPDLVALEMDLFWTVAGGADPLALLDDFPRHYRLMHVKDMSTRVRFSGDGGDASQWMALFPHMTTAGSGVLDLSRILGRAKRRGVEHFFVEQDLAPDPGAALGASLRHLRQLELQG